MLPSPGQFCFVLFCFVRALVPGSLNCSEFRSSGLPVPPDLGFEEAPSRASGMEHCYLRQPISRAEAVPERRSRLWQMDALPLPLPPRPEVLCPQPRRAARIPFAVSVNKAIPRFLDYLYHVFFPASLMVPRLQIIAATPWCMRI